MLRLSIMAAALCACTAAPPAAQPISCPTSGDFQFVLDVAPNALESLCTDASPPTLNLAVSWAADGGGSGNGIPYVNVQCADGSIDPNGCPPSAHPVPVECLATLPVQRPCPPECSITLWTFDGDASLGSIGVTSYADGAPGFVWTQNGTCMYQASF